MNRPGGAGIPGSQAGLRGLPAHMFAQPQQQNPGSLRGGGATAGNRLQNGKLGNTNWNFGGGIGGGLGGTMGGGLGNNNAGARGMNSFAQAMGGGSHGQAALDMSEFPSLSGAPQNQQASAAQMWSNNPSIRAGPNPAVQRPGAQNMQSLQSGSSQPSNQHSQLPSQNQIRNDDNGQSNNTGFPTGTSADDFRFSSTGMQRALNEEFPPLGGLGPSSELGGQDNASMRRSSLFQASGFGQANGDRALGSTIGDRSTSGMASPNTGDSDRLAGPRLGRTLTNPVQQHGMPPGFRNDTFQDTATSQPQQPPIGRPPAASQHSSQQPQQSSQSSSPGAAQRAQPERLKDMSPSDYWGLKGLAVQLDPQHPDYNPMIQGVDLNTLGMDLNRPDNSPLFPDFHLFDDPALPANSSRPGRIIPEYRLPPAYQNIPVPPLHSKIGSFSDDALFSVFYTQIRDVAQELAARELHQRGWRWHTKRHVWLQKDPTVPPIPLPHDGDNGYRERGFYVFFDPNTFERRRQEAVLDLRELEQRLPAPASYGMPSGGPVGGGGGRQQYFP